MVTIILGTQWGDEGKGKITDLFSEKADIVVRFNGGNNAGHTIINEHGIFPLHLVPAGIFRKRVISLITNGVVIDPHALVKEIKLLTKAGIIVPKRLFISPRCHLIMPYHKILDMLYEEVRGKEKTGTTGRGIGPVYADKVSYNGIRMGDLFERELFAEKLRLQLDLKNKLIKALGGATLDYQRVFSEYRLLTKALAPYISETFSILQDAIAKKKRVLLEGAQGVFLDNDWGTYPFVTASSVVSGGAGAEAGIAPQEISRVIGVAKAYVTRVGEGPFPTELRNADGERLAKEGKEFGTTTGRQRRCGWLDGEGLRFAVKLNGITEFIITKLDVLDSFATIKICIGYRLNGKKAGYVEVDSSLLGRIKPVYKVLKGWKRSTREVKRYKDLPKEAKAYIEIIEKLAGVKVSYISNGPKRDEIIKR